MPGYQGKANYNGKSYIANFSAKDKAKATAIMQALYDTEVQIDKESTDVPKTDPSSTKQGYTTMSFSGISSDGKKSVHFNKVKIASSKSTSDVETALVGKTFDGVTIAKIYFKSVSKVKV